jgi:hypothetical protein
MMNLNIQIVTLALPIVLASCASYGPYHPNTSAEPLNSGVKKKGSVNKY